jgi:hypothetical protein
VLDSLLENHGRVGGAPTAEKSVWLSAAPESRQMLEPGHEPLLECGIRKWLLDKPARSYRFLLVEMELDDLVCDRAQSAHHLVDSRVAPQDPMEGILALKCACLRVLAKLDNHNICTSPLCSHIPQSTNVTRFSLT